MVEHPGDAPPSQEAPPVEASLNRPGATQCFPFACWMLPLVVVGWIALTALGLLLATIFVWLVINVPVLAALFALPVALGIYSILCWYNFATLVRLGDRELYIWRFFRWQPVPYADVVAMIHVKWSYHLVCVRTLGPFHIPLFGSPFSRYPAIPLVWGITDRERLFWEIHRRACTLQGREIPVRKLRWWLV